MHGIYIHIPFCKSRCQYCDFFSTTLLDRRKDYVNALIEEWGQRHVSDIATIYIGGGTPSLLEPDDLSHLLSSLTVQGAIHPFEITLEANPGDITADKLQAWQAAGVNRLSIGIQSFNDRLLSLIGRRHAAEQAQKAVAMAQQAGLTNISIDLMYGLPTQTMTEWEQSIRKALDLNVQHISCYCLSYEEGTPLFRRLQQGEVTETDEDTLNAMYDTLCSHLQDKGFEHYEVSNFALPEFRSQHNSSYWNDTPYIGLGAGAHSYDGLHRRWNINDIDAYIQGVHSGSAYYEQETLTAEQRHIERIMLSLRTAEGCSVDEVCHEKYAPLVEQGLLRLQSDHLVATQQGLHILNRIIEDLL